MSAAALATGAALLIGRSSPEASGVTTSSRSATTGPLSAKAIAARVDPGLVNVNVVFGLAGARGAATGMVLTPSGEVLTNNHVVEGASSISVTDIGNGRTYTAHVVGYSRTRDVAVLQLQGASGLTTVPLGDSSLVSVGARVTALGNAGGSGGTPKVARGSVVALDRTITAADSGGGNAERLHGVIQTNAPIRPGDSGGPLVDTSGQVIGMDAAASASYGPSGSSSSQGFAIPIDTALGLAQQIEAGVSSSIVHTGPTAFLGVEVVPAQQTGFGIAPVASGATIGGVLPGYPAQHAGLSAGDVITAVNGQQVATASGLSNLLTTYHPGDTVRLAWVSPNGQTHTTAVTLTSGPPA